MADTLHEWIGRQQQASDEVSLAAIKRLAALLDVPLRPYRRGDAIPKGWYVVLFTPEDRRSLLGPDGHPHKGQFIPPVPLPRRMFAGRRVEFHDVLRIGDEVNRLSRIARIEPKQGRSGKMCFVTVRHEISGPRGLAVVEEHDIVYREEPKPGAPKPEAAPAPGADSAEWTRSIVPDSVLLFRYSAVTFNSHRIHYDADYVRDREGYPDLVMNGGLMTLGGKSVTPKMASKFLHMNRNKRSVVLDLKQPAARGALKRLCAGADVLVVNMRAAALKRLGLGYDELRAANGKLVYCSLVGFGQSGRYAAKPAYDTIIQGSAGVAACHARSTGTPRYTPMVMADHIVGLIAVQMVLLALYHRKSSGAGQHVEVPMFENMAAFVMSEHMYLRTFDPPLGATGDPRVLEPDARPLPTADGFICVSANTDKQAFAFFDAVGRPELKADRRFDSVAARFANVRDYFEVRAQSLRSKTTGKWLELLERADVPCKIGRAHV